MDRRNPPPKHVSADVEVADIKKRVAQRQAEVERLQRQLAQANADKAAAQKACAEGILAAKQQITRLKVELLKKQGGYDAEAHSSSSGASASETADPLDYGLAVKQDGSEGLATQSASSMANAKADVDALRMDARKLRSELSKWKYQAVDVFDNQQQHAMPSLYDGDTDGDNDLEEVASIPRSSPQAIAQAEVEEELQHEKCDALRTEARKLRHELSKWKHQAETFEGERPKQEDEIVRMKVDLTHTLEVLESTRHAVKHHEVEQTLQRVPDQDSPKGKLGHVKLLSGGHGAVEAMAERGIRERTERRNEELFGKARQLTNIVAAQQLLIQRLEKQLIFEEGVLERKTAKLTDESSRQKGLKTVLRKCSDEAVFLSLRAPSVVRKKKGLTKPTAADLFLGDQANADKGRPRMPKADSSPLLPRI